MTNEDHVAALTAVFDRIKIANPLMLTLMRTWVVNVLFLLLAFVVCARERVAAQPGEDAVADWTVFTPDYEDQGSNTNLLISSDRDRATINAMPRMSGIPVNISRS